MDNTRTHIVWWRYYVDMNYEKKQFKLTADWLGCSRHAYCMRETVAQFNLNVTRPTNHQHYACKCNIVVPTSVFLFWKCTCINKVPGLTCNVHIEK